MSIIPNVGGGSIGKDLAGGGKYHLILFNGILKSNTLFTYSRFQSIQESERFWEPDQVPVKEA
jgi:hypothetical protein